MTIKELRLMTGMKRKEFASYLGIPLGTVRNWEQNVREPTDYMVSLIERVLVNEGKLNGQQSLQDKDISE